MPINPERFLFSIKKNESRSKSFRRRSKGEIKVSNNQKKASSKISKDYYSRSPKSPVENFRFIYLS